LDRQRFSAIAHTRHRICCPVSEERAKRILALLNLPSQASVVDFGCGKAEWLRLIADQHDIFGVGLDSNAGMLEAASENCANYPNISIQGQDASTFKSETTIDLIICVGASGIFGGYRGALEAFSKQLESGKTLLIGEGFWRKEPHPDYLLATGIPREEMESHFDNIAVAQEVGFQEMFSIQSTQEEWDEYEGLYLFNVIDYLANHPEASDAQHMFNRINNWREAYLKWGKDTMGFGLYLFRKV